jgi:hypothetical protein
MKQSKETAEIEKVATLKRAAVVVCEICSFLSPCSVISMSPVSPILFKLRVTKY